MCAQRMDQEREPDDSDLSGGRGLWDPASLALLLERCHCGQSVVLTNGCFDLLHRGHVEILRRARELGDVLVVALNTDDSVRRIKGPGRPLTPLADRAAVVGALAAVDYVTFFDEPTPRELIRALPVDVLVKGGDWPEELVVGGDLVRRRGGRVVSLASSFPALSTSAVLQRIRGGGEEPGTRPAAAGEGGALEVLGVELAASTAVHGRLLERCGEAIVRGAELIGAALRGGGTCWSFGNGGSAGDAQHFAAELVGRFRRPRGALRAAALTTDSSILTALGNDFGFEQVFARQIEAHGRLGDVAVGLSTSGESANVLAALMRARERGLATVGLTGENGRRLAGICDVAIQVPAAETARIQEAHITILHCLVELLERGEG